MLKNRLCQHCNKHFENIEGKIFSNHVKWCKSNPNSPKNKKTICIECGETIPDISIKKHICKQTKLCLYCNNTFLDYHNNESSFCSHSCSAKHQNRKRKESGLPSPIKGFKYELVDRICECGNAFSISNNQHNIVKCDNCRSIEWVKGKRVIILKTRCVICNNEAKYKKGNNIVKTCSKECYSIYMSKINRLNHNCGGETNYKKFVYNGITMDSSWEVEVAKLMDSLNIKWERNKKSCLWWFDETNSKRRYYPDFYLKDFNVYLDTKNKYLMIKDAYKIQKVLENNKVTLIVGSLEFVKDFIIKLSTQSI